MYWIFTVLKAMQINFFSASIKNSLHGLGFQPEFLVICAGELSTTLSKAIA